MEQTDLQNYKTDLHQIFRNGRHVGVDVKSGIVFPIGQGTLPWQPTLGAKSAEMGDNTPAVWTKWNGWVTTPGPSLELPRGWRGYCAYVSVGVDAPG